ncbi:uncharacterized protein TrAtP1_005747 [Trichoderma atroviride]|uniref:uncharacterized protein n=1 Tax=Hypocrea atroviridis TaxID=63577 RepID=UPI00332B7A2B|nr:hypothetical protein TrAtP1_005747 [Trichoderma atroviride]
MTEVASGGGGGGGGNGGGGTKDEREVLLPRRRGSEACTSCRRAGRAGQGHAVPSTPRVSGGRASAAFHTQHRRKGVPPQPEPEPEPEPGALLRRGPLADGVAPLAVLRCMSGSFIGAKWGQGFKSSARIDVHADMAARCRFLSLL